MFEPFLSILFNYSTFSSIGLAWKICQFKSTWFKERVGYCLPKSSKALSSQRCNSPICAEKHYRWHFPPSLSANKPYQKEVQMGWGKVNDSILRNYYFLSNQIIWNFIISKYLFCLRKHSYLEYNLSTAYCQLWLRSWWHLSSAPHLGCTWLLATLVALQFTPVGRSVTRSFKLA